MVKIRLARLGDKKSPFYRVIVADSRSSRDGKFIEVVGTYNPLVEENGLNLKEDRIKEWLANGAQPTDTARALIEKAGILEHKAVKKVYKQKTEKKED